MNNSFLSLPDDRRTSIINAALGVFSKYGYKKSPMNEIAKEAGIRNHFCSIISRIKRNSICIF